MPGQLHEWKDILSNKEQYPDDLKIEGIGLTVGELRNQVLPKGDMTAMTEKAAKEKRELEGQLGQYVTAYQQLHAQWQQASSKAAAKGTEGVDELSTYITDPTFSPIATRVQQLSQQIEDATKRLQQHELIYNTNQHAAVYAQIREKDKEFDGEEGLKKLTTYAVQHGLPNLHIAHQLMTRDRDIAAGRESAKQEGIAEGLKQAKLPSMLSGSRRTASKQTEPAASMSEAEENALADPEIAAIWAGGV